MPQKTNLNISPYYDDFDKADNFYKILFKPGLPVQARELTGLQSLLQNQVESFGKHIFKEGSMVIPGNIELDRSYFSAKVNETHLGIDVSIYLSNLLSNNGGKGTRVRGQTSGIVATIKNFILPPAEGVDNITIFIKYIQSGTDGESTAFPDGEVLILEEPLTYGNTTLTIGETVLTLVSENATATGCAFGVNEGVYFMRGSFVDVSTSLIILEPYNAEPSYRVGFDISEEIINSNDDASLYDNAKGFTNFAAPGADRFKISVKLAKKALNDYEDTNFVELMRVDTGEIKKLQNTASYSEIKAYFAKRTFDESGNYAIDPFRVNVQDSLNDEVGSTGLFTEGRVTDQGNVPNEDLMCVKLSPGKAYVKGFDVNLSGTSVLDVEKPRDIQKINAASVPFEMGSLLRVNNVQGTPLIKLGGATAGANGNVIKLFNQRKNGGSASLSASSGLEIGQARIYSYQTSDAPYTGDTTEFDLYLYDIQTYTILTLGSIPNSLPVGTRVRGLSSGSIGFLAKASDSTGANEIALLQTTGAFIQGEQLILNEKDDTKLSIQTVLQYTVDDIKSVFQDSDSLDSDLQSNFSADSVLYDRVLPGFSVADQLTVVGTAASVSNRNFAGKVGIKTDSIIAYETNNADPIFNRITSVSTDGKVIGLTTTVPVSGINLGTVTAGTSPFRIKVPRVLNLNSAGLFSRLPRRIVESVDAANSNLIISQQIKNQNISSSSISFSSQTGLNATAGITSIFFEPFDVEKYSIHYSDGTTEPLTDDQVTISNGGANISFDGLSKSSGTATVNVTLKKLGITSKTKDFLRSQTLDITRTAKINNINSGLTIDNAYGMRIEDDEISLNVPDVVNVVAVYESKNTAAPVLDKLTFVSGLSLNTNAIIGERILGVNSRAIGQVISAGSNTIEFVYLNDSKFTIGEVIKFKESGIETILQGVDVGNFIDRTDNFNLDKGHRNQFCDYSRIVRKAKTAVPAKRLLVIFDQYQVASGNTGDLFTVNSYTKERYTTDIPDVPINLFSVVERATDLLDNRPRVIPFVYGGSGNSPFAFTSRSFESTNPYVITPNESSLIGFNHYLGRIDKLVINKNEEVQLIKGDSAENPVPPAHVSDDMEIAEIELPPFLFDTILEPEIRLRDNRRFTMRDIANLEKRIINLETLTSLNALELDTKSFQVRDADGLDRFKTGFVVNDFKDRSFIDFRPDVGSSCDVDIANKQLISAIDFWSMNPELALNPAIDVSTADTNSNLQLLDANCQKTGDLITLKYSEVDWIENPHATTAVNVNPFNVLVFSANIKLDPPSDNWSRTIYNNNSRTESTGARWAEQSNVVSRREVGRSTRDIANISMGGMGGGTHNIAFTRTTVTNRVERSFTNVLTGPSREFTYVESTKVNSEADPFMRSRNVYFATSNLKPFTKHYHFLDSGIPDIVPKIIEITMSSGTFSNFEDVRVEVNGTQIGLIRSQSPNHKFGDASRPEVGAGLGSPNRAIEVYQVDPFDRTRPAPSETYSATSRLFNVDCVGLANLEKYFGYVVVGAKLTGVSSGAVAIVDNIDLNSDNWGDLLGTFFFRDPNTTPRPPVVFKSGTLTFRITSSKDNVIVPFSGDAPLQSSGSADFLGTGVVITQDNQSVNTRNPARPPQRPNAFSLESTSEFGIRQSFEAPDDDPLAQSFTVDGTGAFLTSFDVYFKSKDPIAKLQVQLRTVELGVPTSFLVQDYAAITLNPSEINVSDDASVPTTIRFTSPIYLQGGEMYSLVFLCPSSDKYEMWVATMGEKSVRTTQLPDVQNVVVSKQYLGGSLYKSQNGTIWTPSQNQDLTFKLRKAAFVESGSTTFYNTPIEPGNFNCQTLINNPIRTLPRKLKVSITGSGTRTNANLPKGRKVSTGAAGDSEDQSVTGVIEGQGAGITGESIILGGNGYAFSSTTAVPTVALTGSGTGATVNLSESGGVVSSITINAAGSGYQVGDVLTVDNSSTKVTRGDNLKFQVTSIATSFDTLYLTDVQGEKFTNGQTLVQYTNTNANRTVVTNVTIDGDSVQNGDLFAGNVFEVTQFNHAHHGALNRVEIKNVKPDTIIVPSTSDLTAEGTTVSLANTAPFATFSGIATDRGEALINEEIVSYIIGSGQLTLTRGVLNTTALPHPEGSSIQTYEASGVSLAGINTIFTIPTNTTLVNESDIDNYYLEINRSALDPLNQRTENSLLCFADEKAVGGNLAQISQNHQYSSFSPQIAFITPGTTTDVNTTVRTISGTSAGGSEISFIDQGFSPTTLGETTFFTTPRLIASTINENKLTFFPKQKSLALNIDMTTADENLSPILDTKNATFIYGRNKINNPIGRNNYATDDRSNQISNDPHGSVFVTDRVDLEQPATSLKVILGASVEPEADIRVYYRLFSADSSETSSTYRPFPGFNNMIDEDGDGFGDTVIDPAKSDGRPDKFVIPNRFDEFSEYRFTADDLEQFNAFTIKIVMTSTNESVPVKIKDFRAIALA